MGLTARRFASRFPRAARIALIPIRFWNGLSWFATNFALLAKWIVQSKEHTNYTYDLRPMNEEYLASLVSLVTGDSYEGILDYLNEIHADEGLREHIRVRTAASAFRAVSDEDARYGRRVGWYAFIRAMKPKIVVETGVDKGLGACVICRALQRNAENGHPGTYYGTDVNPDAGWLIGDMIVGKILYGDSIESLKRLDKIDLFINDSDHSADYEAREYETILSRLSPGGIILGDNAHCTNRLQRFSIANGRRFLFWEEKPAGHWYPGAGIGVSFPRLP